MVIRFLFLRRILYNTWKSHYRQLQVLIMIFNKKPLKVFVASPTQNPPWNLLSFASRTAANKSLKNSVQNCLILLWFQIIGKTIKTLGFQNITTRFFFRGFFRWKLWIAGLKKFSACSQVFKFVVEWIPAIRNNV